MDRLLDRPIKAAAIETPLDQFAYWLERDWPRTQELKWLTLSQDNIRDTNPLYERRWVTRVRNSWPVLIITAESMTPGRVVVAWVEWARSTYTDIPHPVEAMAGWVRFRFRVEAEDAAQDAPAAVYARQTTYAESDVGTTLVDYLIKRMGKSQKVAAGLVGVSDKTYRNHRDSGKLLSADEFRRRTLESIEDAAQAVLLGKWSMR